MEDVNLVHDGKWLGSQVFRISEQHGRVTNHLAGPLTLASKPVTRRYDDF